MLMKLTPEGSCVRSKKESKKNIFLEKVSWEIEKQTKGKSRRY